MTALVFNMISTQNDEEPFKNGFKTLIIPDLIFRTYIWKKELFNIQPD
jgi:hypothetical protein